MRTTVDAKLLYACPMHQEARQTVPGTCPRCGMDLLPEGTRFGLLRHMTGDPWMLVSMVSAMAAVMAAFMMMR